MKYKCMAAILLFAFVQQAFADTLTLTKEEDKLSYAAGVDVGKTIKYQEIKLNEKAFIQGLRDAINGTDPQMTRQEIRDVLTRHRQTLVAKRAEAFKQKAVDNQKKSQAFLAQNKTRDGVVTLKNGLQYRIISEGNGPKPTLKDTVEVKYTGRLVNGTVFDSTERTGKAVTIRLTDVIPGWTQVLQLMREGSTWEVFIPAKLAYGERGVGGPIGPNQALIFNIQLIKVNAGAAGKRKS